jgi:hypothetical protein
LELRERYRLGLHPVHGEGQDEEEGCQRANPEHRSIPGSRS